MSYPHPGPLPTQFDNALANPILFGGEGVSKLEIRGQRFEVGVISVRTGCDHRVKQAYVSIAHK